jgi:acetyl-CoA acetyltransferase family protein
MRTVVYVGGGRTPFMKHTTFSDNTATEMSAHVIKELLKLYPKTKDCLDLLICANVSNQLLPPDGSNLGRVIALTAGLSKSLAAYTINLNCASGLHAAIEAVKEIELGLRRCVLVVAVEAMSDAMLLYSREQRNKFRELLFASKTKGSFWKRWMKIAAKLPAYAQFHRPINILEQGLIDPTTIDQSIPGKEAGLSMIQIAELIATNYKISRGEQDLFALNSHRRAFAAREKLKREIFPYRGLDYDNGVAEKVQLADFAKRRPLNGENGTITAGNSSQVSDGACALLFMEERLAKELCLPIETVMCSRYTSLCGCEQTDISLGPVLAIEDIFSRSQRCLGQKPLRLSDMDLIETNEAFAVVPLAQNQAMKNAPDSTFYREEPDEVYVPLNSERTNVNGGAIAIGHPLAASGARLVQTIARELAERQARWGLVTLCVGGGQGEAALIERRSL